MHRIWLGTQARLLFDRVCPRDEAPWLLVLAAKDLGSASSPTLSNYSQLRGAPMLRMPATTFVGIAGACV